jgi:Leu/Phe-tRNA-protein transferase
MADEDTSMAAPDDEQKNKKVSGRLGDHSADVHDGTDSESDNDKEKRIAVARQAWEWNQSVLKGSRRAQLSITFQLPETGEYAQIDSRVAWVTNPKHAVPLLEQLWHLPVSPDLDDSLISILEEIRTRIAAPHILAAASPASAVPAAGHSIGADYKLSREQVLAIVDSILNAFIGQIREMPFHFYWGGRFAAKQIAAYARAGFLPMALNLSDKGEVAQPVPLFKLHRKRCVIDLNVLSAFAANPKSSLGDDCREALFFRAARSNRGKRSNVLRLSVNESFMKVVEGLNKQHKDSSWIYEPLVEAYLGLNVLGAESDGMQITGPVGAFGVQVHSIEVWEGDQLIAGELGYTVGASYTSLSGFHAKSGSGTVQMLALGELLRSRGFVLWDLGMVMKYKVDIGGQVISRGDFLKMFYDARSMSNVELVSSNTNYTCSHSCGELVQSIRIQETIPTEQVSTRKLKRQMRKENAKAGRPEVDQDKMKGIQIAADEHKQ